MASGRKTRLRRRGDRQRPIVPQGCPCSIVGAGELNDRVRDGNGCIPSAIVTSLPARTDERVKSFESNGPQRLCGRGDRQRPIVPQGCPCSIVGAGELNDRVRDGNGCIPSAIVTSLPARTDERVKSFESNGPQRLCGRGDRQRPIVPQGCPCSIVGAGELNDRVRDGNGCIPSAIVTSLPARRDAMALQHMIPGHDRREAGERGGDEGTRTPDPLDANQMLSQLSYAPRRVLHSMIDCKRYARWAFPGSNRGPQSYQDCALTN